MSWFKNAINSGWQEKGLYHFTNVMKFVIDSFPNLSLSDIGSATSRKIVFNIVRNNETEYNFLIRINGNNIDTSIYAKPLRSLSSRSYDASQSEPQQIIEDGLAEINNDYSGEFENGMV